MTSPVRIPNRSRNKLSPSLRRRVYQRDNWTCQYCGRHMPPLTAKQENGDHAPAYTLLGKPIWLEVDHVVPRALGGGNAITNLRAACSPCNRRKNDSTKAVDWELRVALALEILTTKEPGKSAAMSAVTALLGVAVHVDFDGTVSVR